MSYEGPPGLISLRAVFLLQTLFAPATWAVPCIVAYGPPVVNNWVHARTRRVPTEIVRDLGTSLKAAADPQHIGMSSTRRFGRFPRHFPGSIPNILWSSGLRTQWWGEIRCHNHDYRKTTAYRSRPARHVESRGADVHIRIVAWFLGRLLGLTVAAVSGRSTGPRVCRRAQPAWCLCRDH
jgi:hypothetical protein